MKECIKKIKAAYNQGVPQGGLDTIHILAAAGEVECLIWYLKNASNMSVDKACNKGHTPLHYAIIKRSLPCVKALVEHGADIDKDSVTFMGPMFIAFDLAENNILNYLVTNTKSFNVFPHSLKAHIQNNTNYEGQVLLLFAKAKHCYYQQNNATTMSKYLYKAHQLNPYYYEQHISKCIGNEDSELIRQFKHSDYYTKLNSPFIGRGSPIDSCKLRAKARYGERTNLLNPEQEVTRVVSYW